MKANKKDLTGWGNIKENWFNVLLYICLLIIILFFMPPIWITLPLIYSMIIIKAIKDKKFKLKSISKSIGISTVIILTFYLLYWLVGGLPAIIIAHVVGGGMILYASWKFIKQQWANLKYCIDKGIKEPRRRHKQWQESQKLQKNK